MELGRGEDSMREYVYVRVSSSDQNESRQVDAVAELQIPSSQVYIDKQSGKDFERPAWKELMKKLEKGDVLYAKSIDRIGRDYEEIQKYWRILTKEMGVDIAIIDMPILDTRRGKDLLGTFIADTVLAVLSFVSATELSHIRQRQAEGIAAAKARGVRFGRPAKELPDNFAEILRKKKKGEISLSEALNQTGLAQTTFYRYVREFQNTQ